MKRLFVLALCFMVFASLAFADGPILIDDAKDAALEAVADVCETFFVGTDGTYANRLGSVAVTVGAGNGDYTIQNGETEGRSLTILEQSITASGDGTADTWGLYDTDTETVMAYGNLTSSVVMETSAVYEFSTLNHAITINDPD
jgi:hypothetical protein